VKTKSKVENDINNFQEASSSKTQSYLLIAGQQFTDIVLVSQLSPYFKVSLEILSASLKKIYDLKYMTSARSSHVIIIY